MARPKDPAHLKLLRGSDKRNIQTSPQAPPQGRMWTPPDFIGVYGKALWKQLGPVLRRAGLLTELDRGCFEALCVNYDMMVSMTLLIQKEGEVIKDARGSLKKHPATSVLNAFMSLFRQSCCDFGCTPASRGKMGIQFKNTEFDPVEAFRNRKKSRNPWSEI